MRRAERGERGGETRSFDQSFGGKARLGLDWVQFGGYLEVDWLGWGGWKDGQQTVNRPSQPQAPD